MAFHWRANCGPLLFAYCVVDEIQFISVNNFILCFLLQKLVVFFSFFQRAVVAIMGSIAFCNLQRAKQVFHFRISNFQGIVMFLVYCLEVLLFYIFITDLGFGMSLSHCKNKCIFTPKEVATKQQTTKHKAFKLKKSLKMDKTQERCLF